MVAGGGGGGLDFGGAGGAGGLELHWLQFPLKCSVTIGGGGLGHIVHGTSAGDGSNSVFGSITSWRW